MRVDGALVALPHGFHAGVKSIMGNDHQVSGNELFSHFVLID